jgi:hypothetical protein
MTKFAKGQSGNPNGRPPKNRALTDLLESAGNSTIERDGKKIARKRIVASLAWELLTTGETVLPNGTALKLAPQDWIGLYKWIYGHIDGPPKAEIDVTSDGKPIGYIVTLEDDNEPEDTSQD